MNQQTIEKIVHELDNIPDERAESILHYLDFIKYEDDVFSPEESAEILQGMRDARAGMGVDFRTVRSDI